MEPECALNTLVNDTPRYASLYCIQPSLKTVFFLHYELPVLDFHPLSQAGGKKRPDGDGDDVESVRI